MNTDTSMATGMNFRADIFKAKRNTGVFSRRASVLILTLVVCCSGASLTRTAEAQEQPRAKQVQAQATPESPMQEEHQAEKKSEAEEINEYRHSASVHWFANLLHVDVETAAKLFEYINFAVILLALGIPLLKIVPSAMKKRSAKLSFDLEQAKAETIDAKERLSAVEAKLAGLDAEITAIRKQVDEEMRQDEERIKNSIEEDTARIVASVEHDIHVAASQAQRGLKEFVAELVIDRALSQLTLTAETDRAMIAEFASDVAGGRGKHKGGQN